MSNKKWALHLEDIGADRYAINLLNIDDKLGISVHHVDKEFQALPTTIDNSGALNKLANNLIDFLNKSDLDIYCGLMKAPAEEIGRFPESGYYWIKFHSSSAWTVREYFNATDTFMVAGTPFKARDVHKIYPQRLMLPNEILATPRAE